jgi:hypothetical protein
MGHVIHNWVAEALIAIVASAVTLRNDYDPALKNLDNVQQAAKELGRELAKARCRIMVFASDPSFIEAAFIWGYVGSGQAKAPL